MLQKIREFGEKGGHFGAGIREKESEIWILEHEYVPFLGPSGEAGVGVQSLQASVVLVNAEEL